MVESFVIVLKNLQQMHKNSIEMSNSTAEATGELIGNKIANKITGVSKKKSTKELPNEETEEDTEINTHKKYAYLQKKDRKLLMN